MLAEPYQMCILQSLLFFCADCIHVLLSEMFCVAVLNDVPTHVCVWAAEEDRQTEAMQITSLTRLLGTAPWQSQRPPAH